MVSIKPTLATMKKDRNFFSQLYLIFKLNIFVDFIPFSITGPVCNLLFHTFLYIPKIHQSALAIDMLQLNGWEALLLQLFFNIF